MLILNPILEVSLESVWLADSYWQDDDEDEEDEEW